MTSELKPCPKCGGRNLTTFIGGGRAAWGIWESATFDVECECGTQFYVEVDVDTKMDSRPDDEIREYTYQKGIEAWNTRAERTCKIKNCGNYGICTECGAELTIYEDYDPWEDRFCGNYCPKCGAKVVE